MSNSPIQMNRTQARHTIVLFEKALLASVVLSTSCISMNGKKVSVPQARRVPPALTSLLPCFRRSRPPKPGEPNIRTKRSAKLLAGGGLKWRAGELGETCSGLDPDPRTWWFVPVPVCGLCRAQTMEMIFKRPNICVKALFEKCRFKGSTDMLKIHAQGKTPLRRRWDA